jgi:hypothetical protein
VRTQRAPRRWQRCTLIQCIFVIPPLSYFMAENGLQPLTLPSLLTILPPSLPPSLLALRPALPPPPNTY